MQESLLKSDIFFVITTAAVIIITTAVVIGLVYIISVVRTIKEIARVVKTGTDIALDGVTELRDQAREGVVNFRRIIGIFRRFKKLKKH